MIEDATKKLPPPFDPPFLPSLSLTLPSMFQYANAPTTILNGYIVTQTIFTLASQLKICYHLLLPAHSSFRSH